MGYEDARRHLEPVRDHFEKNKILRVESSYISKSKGEPTAMINVDAEYIGTYLRDNKLIIMMRFDDRKVPWEHIDIAYDVIRERTKKVLVNHFPGLTEKDLGVYVMDSSGELVDVEFE